MTDYEIIERGLNKLAASSPNLRDKGLEALGRIKQGAGDAPEQVLEREERLVELEQEAAVTALEVDGLNAKIARLEEQGIESMKEEIKQLQAKLLDALGEAAYSTVSDGSVDWADVPDVTKASWRAHVSDAYAQAVAEAAGVA